LGRITKKVGGFATKSYLDLKPREKLLRRQSVGGMFTKAKK